MNAMRVKESHNAIGSSVCLYDFVMSAKFCDLDLPIDITESVKDDLKDLHPAMIIGGGVIRLNMYTIKYTYSTIRGNIKEGMKYMLLGADNMCENDYEAEIQIEDRFMDWVCKYNCNYPYRAISNVQILEIVPYANAQLSIG